MASRTAIMDVAAHDRLAEIWADIRPFEDEAAARRHTFYQSFFRLYDWARARSEFHEDFGSYVDDQIRIALADQREK